MIKSVLFIFTFLVCSLAHAGGQNSIVNYESDVSATTSSTRVLSSSPRRQYLIIQNKGSNTVYVKFGSSQTGTEGISIPASGGYYEPMYPPTDSVYVVTGSGTSNIHIIEGR